MKGWVSEEEKQSLMSECKMFVMPSLYESYGLAALEIMSYGRPVVCTDVNGLPDTVKDGGVYVKPKDAKGLADAINSLLADKDKRRELGGNARKVAENQNVKNTVDIIESVYRDVMRS
jgi:glycosyltransferase involved in cell wall biosynthesis